MLQLETKTITHKGITFTITPERVYLQNRLQAFLLEPTEYYYNKRLRRIALLIELGHIRTYNDLFEHTRVRDKYGYDLEAIRCVPIKKAWML